MADFESAYDTIQRQRKENADLRTQLDEATNHIDALLGHMKVDEVKLATLQREVNEARENVVMLTKSLEASTHEKDKLRREAWRAVDMLKGDDYIYMRARLKRLATDTEGGKDG